MWQNYINSVSGHVLMNKLPSGSPVLDELLDGGYETDVITLIYGPAGSGKTTACLLAASHTAQDKKVLFIDTEGGFSSERFSQLCSDAKLALSNIMLLKPTTFDAQQNTIDKLNKMITEQVGLIVCDTISALYRTERTDDNAGLNRMLAKQLGLLLEIARSHHIPVLLTNQVYADFDNKNTIKMVGGDIMRYSSKCLIEFESGKHGNRRATIKKHRSLPERAIDFKIVEKGFEPS